MSKIRQQQSTLELLKKPKPTNYLDKKYRDDGMGVYTTNKKKKENKDINKPVIDYKVKIVGLEKDLLLTGQHFGDTKAKNNNLIQELNELRENVMINNKKLNETKKELKKQETEYYEQKSNIEKNLKNKEDEEYVKEIYRDQQMLYKKNTQMIDLIKGSDKDMTQKLALRKYYEHELIKLKDKKKKVIQKWKNEKNLFFEENAENIKKCTSFDPSSEVLEIITENKISAIEDMLQKIYAKTNLEDIERLVEYFIKCSKEVRITININSSLKISKILSSRLIIK